MSIRYDSGWAMRGGAICLMNSATAIAAGTAMTIAIAAATRVPKARGQMYLTSPSPPGISSEDAVSAGHALTMRNRATPASVARMSTPAPVARPAKNRSPLRAPCEPKRRPLGSISATLTALAPLAGRDGVDRGLDLLAQRVAQRSRAGVLGAGLLALRADDVLQVSAHERALGGVLVLGAGDRVGDEDDRVRGRVLRRAGDREREDVLARVLGLLGGLEDLG